MKDTIIAFHVPDRFSFDPLTDLLRMERVFTMTKAIRSKQHNGIAESLTAQGVDLIDPPLMERAAFSAIFEFGGNLRNMPPQGNISGAIENAVLFAKAVYNRLAERM
jgi:chromosome partitioning protein